MNRLKIAASILVASTSTHALAQTPAPAPAPVASAPSGQTPAPAAPSADLPTGASDGDIIVTALKRAESVQDVPIAIAAFGAQQLQSAAATDLSNVSLLVPSVSIGNVEGRGQISIRGIGVVSVFDIAESAVATHIDGFYVARLSGTVGSFLDLERVEVLKGPQGTLYGRNATAGTINIITNKPTKNFGLSAMVEGLLIDGNGSKGGRDPNSGTGYGVRGSVVLNAPLNDSIRTRFALMKINRDGYKTAIYPDGHKVDIFDADQFYARASVDIDVAPGLTWLLQSDNYWADDRGSTIDITGQSRPDVPLPAVTPTTPNGGKTRRMYLDMPVNNKPRTNAVTSTINYSVNDELSLRSLSQYRFTKYKTTGEFDGSSAPTSAYLSRQTSDEYSQEVQALLDIGKFRATGGLFYFQEREPVTQIYQILLAGPGSFVSTGGISKTKAYAGYADLTYGFTDKLELTLGARYSVEKKSGFSAYTINIPGLVTAVNNLDLPTRTFKSFTPKVVLNYEPTRDLTVYASAQKGFKSGGYNIGGSTSQPLSFNPEKINAYEVGLKSRLFDRRAGLNLAGFYYDYKDLQIQDVFENSNIIRNAATAKIYGVEADGFVALNSGLRFDLSGSWLHAKFTKGVLTNPLYPELPAASIDGNHLPKAPTLSGNASVSYKYKLGNGGSLDPNFTASYRGKQHFTSFDDPSTTQKGYWWLRSSLTYHSPDERWSLQVFGDNLTNKYVYTFAIPSIALNGFPLQTAALPPRTFGLRLDWKL